MTGSTVHGLRSAAGATPTATHSGRRAKSVATTVSASAGALDTRTEMFVALDTLVRKRLRRTAAVAAVLALMFAVVTAHGALAQHHADDHGSAAVLVVVCVAVAAPVVAAGWATRAARTPWARLITPVLAPVIDVAVEPHRPPPRAGPARLQVFLR